MEFNYFTLYFVLGWLELIVLLILIYYIATVRPNNKSLYIFGIYKALGFVAIMGFSLLHTSIHFLSLNLTVMFLYMSWCAFGIGIVSYKGAFFKKYNIRLYSITLLSGLMYLVTKGITRECITAIITTFIFVSAGIHLISYRDKFKLPILIGICSFLFALSNIIRALAILRIGESFVMLEVYTVETIHVIVSLGLTIISTIGYFLLLSELDKRTIFEKNRINTIALEQSPLSIVMTNYNGTISYVNPAFCSITGYQPSEVMGQNPSILKSGQTPAEVYQSMWQTLTSGNIWVGEFTNKKKNEDIYFEEAAIAPLKNERGVIKGFLALKTDITERKKAEQTILKQNTELSALNYTKNRLFSIIAHDLRNPIGGLMSFLELTKDLLQEGDEAKALNFLDMAIHSSKTSYDLLENLLHWSRSQLNAVTTNPVLFDITRVIKETTEIYAGLFRQKEIAVKIDGTSGLMVFADMDMVKTVLRNLVSNAIKFTPQQGEIRIISGIRDDMAVICVSDTGVGIEKERLGKLFNFNDNCSTYGTAGEKGTGIGLVLANEFVIKNKGRMWVDSTVGVGTSVYFSLPAKAPLHLPHVPLV
jgi:PAS domain S-box